MTDSFLRKSGYVLTLTCPDAKGIVAAVAGYLADHDCSITESNHFNDADTGQLFMRTAFRQVGPAMPPEAMLRDGFRPIATLFGIGWQLQDATIRPRLLIAVSKFGHCLFDLLHRWRAGLLPWPRARWWPRSSPAIAASSTR
ncbi:MAG: hypothetical protein WDN69_17335 [Aliidongia sp.]